ncbi:hypothetical protein HMPREF1142_2321 [Peptostreptococcaceae bacterium AS15]|nr:hypothetical protein HMPREF1142_2321 [Peptostreptococcaceae bacterium AS15]
MDKNIKEMLDKLNREDETLKTLVIEDMKIVKAYDGKSELSLRVTENMLNAHDMVHGGVIFTLADSASGAACVSYGKKIVTLSSNMNFLKSIDTGTMIAKGEVVHNGNSTMVVDVNVSRQEDDKLLATASFTMFVIGKY